MKPIQFVPIICLLYLLISCSGNKFIVTDKFAYYSDDSLNVTSDLKKIGSSANSRLYTIYDTDPEVINRESPDYPSYKVGGSSYLIEGDVEVQAWINKEGNVKRAYIIKSSENNFNKACLSAVMKSKFKPAYLKGEPVPCWVSIPFHFRLRKP